MTLQVELVSPEQILFSGEAEMVSCRTTDGEIAFLTGHAPFVGALGIGPVTIRTTGGGDEVAAVHGGFVEVSHNRVTILSDVAEMAHQIDLMRAQRSKDEAEAKLREAHDAECEAQLRRAHVRIELAQDRSGHGH
ncbi:MAG: F0F1 ATP synthase subunit epsilon [Acidimicrobiales bacterium]